VSLDGGGESRAGLTAMKLPAQVHRVPRAAILSAWCDCEWGDGVQINRMPELSTLAVQTADSLYEITILNGQTGEVLVRGGPFFPERTLALLSGSSFGGSILKWRGIYAGMHLEFIPQPPKMFSQTVYDEIAGRQEFRVGCQVIWSSPVQSVQLLS
jgi:hypothetical protein